MRQLRRIIIRRGVVAAMLLILCLMAGCSGTNNILKQYTLERRLAVYSPLFFEHKETVLEKLGLSEDEVTEIHQDTFKLPHQEYIGDYAFDVELCFERYSDVFYGFIYTAKIEDLDEALSEYDDLITSFRKKWGEPVTYPDISNRYLDAQDPKPKLKRSGSILEYWDLPTTGLANVPADMDYMLSARLGRGTAENDYTIRLEIMWKEERN